MTRYRKRRAWLVLDYGGEWEDKWERPVRAFSSHKTACECAERRKMRNRLQARWDDLIDYVGSYVISVELIEEVEDA